MWPVDQVVRDSYRLTLDSGAVVPSALDLRVGVYESGLTRHLPAVDSHGESIGQEPTVARLRLGRLVPTSQPLPSDASVFGDEMALVSSKIDRSRLQPGERVTGVLTWRALKRPATDYTVFVQALGERGVVAQLDSQPAGGGYPTDIWPVGEEFAEGFALTLPADLPPGRYRLIVGLYDLKTLRRLPVGQSDHVEVDTLTVE